MGTIHGIFKIQLPFERDSLNSVSVFNESRSIVGLIPLEPKLLMLFPKNEKGIIRPVARYIHVSGQYNEEHGNIHIDCILPDPGW